MLRTASAFALSAALLAACATGKHAPAGPKPFAAGTLLVLDPAIDARGTDVQAGKLHDALVKAAVQEAKGLKVVPDAELRKVLQARGESMPHVDRSGDAALQLLRATGAEYAVFGVVDRAETTGPGMLVGMVNTTGDRSASWVSGEMAAIEAALPREIGAALQDLGASPTGPVKYPSGLLLEVTEVGPGQRPRATDRVKVHYEGKLEDGTVFDSTHKRGEPAVFGLDRVIQCWNEAIPKLHVGSKAKITCPPNIAYGEKGQPPNIPPAATLHFEVELLGIEK